MVLYLFRKYPIYRPGKINRKTFGVVWKISKQSLCGGAEDFLLWGLWNNTQGYARFGVLIVYSYRGYNDGSAFSTSVSTSRQGVTTRKTRIYIRWRRFHLSRRPPKWVPRLWVLVVSVTPWGTEKGKGKGNVCPRTGREGPEGGEV